MPDSVTPGASRHTHALDATITKALAPFFPLRPLAIPLATAAVRDALLAEGRIVYQSVPYSAPLESDWDWERGIWFSLGVERNS